MRRVFIRQLPGLFILLFTLSVSAVGQQFPLTLEHKFGTTVIPEQPERVASIDYGGIGNLLAVGVSPVTVRQWRPMDGFKYTTGPWAEHLLTTEPVVLDGALDFEAIAATEPDVIIALYSGIDEADYDRLSLIAPVVAVPEGVGNYSMSWDERARVAARAVGMEDEAERQIEAIETQLKAIAKANPHWQGMTAALGGFRDEGPFFYTASDVRAKFLYDMGFTQTSAMTELTEDDGFWVSLSPEKVDVIDADVVLYYVTDDAVKAVLDEPARRFLRASENGGEIFLGDLPVAALARVSLLSIPYALDAMIPMLEAAADGDPNTIVPDARLRTVIDFSGNAEGVPVSPQRVVYLGTAPADLLQLGIKPIGSSLSTIRSQVVYPELLEGIEDVGVANNFDLEKITALNPDLIILDGRTYEESHEAMTKIAPTLVFDSRSRMYDRLRLLANFVNQEQAAEAWIESYETRAAATVDALAVNGGGTATVMIVLGENAYVMGKHGLSVTLYDTLGFTPTDKVQALIDSNRNFTQVSEELLPGYTGDWLFVLAQTDQDWERVESSRVFQSIPAVQEGRAYFLEGGWNFDDPVTRDRLLEELIRVMGPE